MRYNQLYKKENSSRGNETMDKSRCEGRHRKGNSFDGSTRFILIASCIVLAIVSILLLFQTCNGGRKEIIEQGKEQLVSTQFFIYNNVSRYAAEHPSQCNLKYQTNNSITATANDILNLIVLNANRKYGDGIWWVGSTPSTSEARIFVNNNYTCYQALNALAEQWSLNWNLSVDQTTGNYFINIYPKQMVTPKDPGSGGGGGFNPTPKISSDGPGSWIISITGLIILLAAYITARVKSKKRELVITANTFDKILILLSPVLFFIAWCIGFDSEFSIVLLSLSGVMLQGSIIFSFIANKGDWLNITLSIMAKLFIFVLTVFLLFLFLAYLIISFLITISRHSSMEETYIVKYDHFLDQWVGYRVD